MPDRIIADLRAREQNGLIVLPPKPGLRRGDQVRITRGPMAERLAIYEGMKGRERVEVLLAMLGQRAAGRARPGATSSACSGPTKQRLAPASHVLPRVVSPPPRPPHVASGCPRPL